MLIFEKDGWRLDEKAGPDRIHLRRSGPAAGTLTLFPVGRATCLVEPADGG